MASTNAASVSALKRDVDRDAFQGTWALRAADLGSNATELVARAMERTPHSRDRRRGSPGKTGRDGTAAEPRQPDLFEHATSAESARKAVDWAAAHLSERDAVFGNTDLLATALASDPGAASIGTVERAVNSLKRQCRLQEASALGTGLLTTHRAVADERKIVSPMRGGQRRGRSPMHGWMLDRHLRKVPLTDGQKQAVKPILSEKDRTAGVQGLAGTGKTTTLNRARTLADGGAGPVGIGRPDAGGRVGR